MSFQGWLERLLRSLWVTRDPSGSRRSRSPSLADTTSRRPSGSQSMLKGDEGKWTMTSLLPSGSTATISREPQSENQRRPSRQRGDSPNTIPVINVCGSALSFSCLREPGSVSVGEEPGQHRHEHLGGHDMFLALQDTVPPVR